MSQFSLWDVQSRYFEIVENNFGSILAAMKRGGYNPQQVANSLASRDEVVNAFLSDIGDFSGALAEFWDFHGPIVEHHLRKQRNLKTVFGGDVFPSYTSNIACSVGLYADTIVLPDPLHRVTTYAGVTPPKSLFRLAVKHALNVLSYRDLALAQLDVPIVVVAPDYIADEPFRHALTSAATTDMLAHFGAIFGVSFSSQADLDAFLKSLPDFESLMSRVSDRSRILFDAESNAPLPEQFIAYRDEFLEGHETASNAGLVLKHMVFGRLLLANDAAMRAFTFGGNPLVDAPTSWRYFQWKNEYQERSRLKETGATRDVLISKSLSLDGREQRMLSGIPPESLIELRKNGALNELRQMMSKGMDDVDTASESDLAGVAASVIDNIDNAFAEHAKQLDELASSRRKFYGLDVSRWIASGGFSIAAAAVPELHILGMLAAVGTVLGASKPEELLSRHRELNAEAERLKRSPTGIMFRHLKKNFGF